nr:LacI family DNA-binding transcriptional regulator [Arthrobacter sp. 35W]
MLDVAAHAGVSRATVSRVFTAPESVAAATLERVLKAVEDLSYSPNAAARSLRSGRSNTVALLVGDISQPFHSQLAKSVAHVAEDRGYSLLLCDLDHSMDRLQRLLTVLPLQGVDGIMLATGDAIETPGIRAAIDAAEAKGTRVLLGSAQPDSSMALTVSPPFEEIGYLATKHLLAQERWPVALLSGFKGSVVSTLLRAGYLRACLEAGHSEKETMVLDAGFNSTSAQRETAKLLDGAAMPRGIVAANIPIALGAISALADRSLSVPDMVALVACEEVQLAEQLRPGLTTAGTDIGVQGEAMALALIDAIEGQAATARALVPHLTVRESSALS